MEEQALKWWQVRWGLAGRLLSRLAIVSGKTIGVLCLIAAAGYCVLYLLSPWLTAKSLGGDPRLSTIPVSLSTKTVAPLSNSSIDHDGSKFQLPNEKIVRTYEGKELTSAQFPNGELMFQNTLREQDFFVPGKDDKRAEKLLGQELIHSRFELMKAAMSMTPGQVKWWRFRSSQNQRAELLLTTKFFALSHSLLMDPYKSRPIYSMALGEVQGFQIGNPNLPPYDTHIDVFDDADQHFELDISGPEGHGQVLTQEELNAIVASICPTSDPRGAK